MRLTQGFLECALPMFFGAIYIFFPYLLNETGPGERMIQGRGEAASAWELAEKPAGLCCVS